MKATTTWCKQKIWQLFDSHPGDGWTEWLDPTAPTPNSTSIYPTSPNSTGDFELEAITWIPAPNIGGLVVALWLTVRNNNTYNNYD